MNLQCPVLRRRLILAVLAACTIVALPARVAAQPVADRFLEAEGGWRTYVNGRFGTRLAYPADLFTPDAGLETGDGRRFVSEDADIEILAWDNEAGDTPETVAARLVGTEGYEDLAAQEIGPSRLVLSGYRDERFFHETFVFEDGLVQALGMEYPVARRAAYDPLLETIAASFPAGEAAASERIAGRDCASGAPCDASASGEDRRARVSAEDGSVLADGSGEGAPQPDAGGLPAEAIPSSFAVDGPMGSADSEPDSCGSNGLCRLVAATPASWPAAAGRAADPAGAGARSPDLSGASLRALAAGSGAASERDRYRVQAANPEGRKATAQTELSPKARASAGEKPKAKAQRAKKAKANKHGGKKPKGKRRGRGKRR